MSDFSSEGLKRRKKMNYNKAIEEVMDAISEGSCIYVVSNRDGEIDFWVNPEGLTSCIESEGFDVLEVFNYTGNEVLDCDGNSLYEGNKGYEESLRGWADYYFDEDGLSRYVN